MNYVTVNTVYALEENQCAKENFEKKKVLVLKYLDCTKICNYSFNLRIVSKKKKKKKKKKMQERTPRHNSR